MWQFGLSTGASFCVVFLPQRLRFFDRSCGVRSIRLDHSCGVNHVLKQGIRMAHQTRDMKSEQKIRIRIEHMGVHDCNRSGVYPAGIRGRDLCIEVLKAGFLKEEFTHALVAVEEKPLSEIRKSSHYVSSSEYNRADSLQDEFLRTCFEEPHGNVQY